jgi:Tfp pilus assembly protein PilF
VRYLTFRLQITAGPAGGQTVHAWSPRGQGQAPFVLPFRAGELEALKKTFAGPGRNLILESPAMQELSPRAIGERLFAALFPDEILRLYERSVDLLTDDPEAGLLQALPWELMRQKDTPEFLALTGRRPFVRSLAVPRAVYAPRRVSTLRILAVASSPRDEKLPPLDLARELRHLKKAVEGHLEIVRPQAPTLAALRQACRETECQVLHFMGHGAAVPGGAEGVLYFETEDGTADPVTGEALVNKLADFPTVRLVVLNACESAAAPQESDPIRPINPLAPVAGSLVLGGMPEVVAMQFPVSDQAAIAFSRAFYQRLAAGDPVEAAVAEGRQAVHSADTGGFEWATPVLFLRGQDLPEPRVRGRWARRLAAALLGLLLIAGIALAGRAWWTERLVAQGVALTGKREWPAALERFQAALELAPGRAEILLNLAFVEEQDGEIQAAEEHYREAVLRRPGSAEPLYHLGHFLNGRGRYDEAYLLLQQAAGREPERADVHGELAKAALGLGMPDRARVAVAVALRLDPEKPALHRLAGEVELKAGNLQAAIAHLNDARSGYALGDRGRAETIWLLMQAYERVGDVTSACRESREFRRLDEAGITQWAPEVEAGAARLGCPR